MKRHVWMILICMLAALLLCMTAATAQEETDVARRLYEMGLAEEEKENYGEAARQYELAAALGSADGMYRLAEIYYDGLTDAGRDMDRAVGYAQMAAERGSVDAMCMLAYLYCEADGVEQNYAEARLYYEQAAALGSADSMVGLGYLYEEGLGVEKDYGEALAWYLKAAEHGSADAPYYAAYCYANGLGTDQDYETALQWYLKGAMLGDADAMYQAGYYYCHGRGTTIDYGQAKYWYEKAIDQGDDSAMNNLGYMYNEGLGMEKDVETALYWYKKAAALGNRTSMNNIAYIYQNGDSIPRDVVRAVYWYHRAEDAGDKEAQKKIRKIYNEYDVINRWMMTADECYIEGKVLSGQMKYVQAALNYEKSVHLGYADSAKMLAELYLNGQYIYDIECAVYWYERWHEMMGEKGAEASRAYLADLLEKGYQPRDEQERGQIAQLLLEEALDKNSVFGREAAYRLFRISAELGNAQAMVQAGSMLYAGSGVAKDEQAAKLWFEKAAALGEPAAMTNLGYLYVQGETSDYAQAIVWFKKAAQLGSSAAMVNLGYMYRNGLGVKKDAEAAAQWYSAAAADGNQQAERELEALLKESERKAGKNGK